MFVIVQEIGKEHFAKQQHQIRELVLEIPAEMMDAA